MANYTLLSTILNRMQRYTTLKTVETQDLVRDLDEAMRTLRRDMVLPWTLKKGSLRVFTDVLEYPVASDHDEIAFLDDTRNPDSYSERPRFKFTSIKEFIENPDYRHDLAEIWDQGTRYLGVRYSPLGVGSKLVDNAEDVDNYTGSGDVGTLAEDTVIYRKGNKSIKVPITNFSGTATVEISFNSFSDSNYLKKYFFVWVYLDASPTSVTIRFGNDSSNYLDKAVTTQFSGQSFKADAWNLLAFDLSNPDNTQGTIDSDAFDYAAVIFTGASTGTYYIDQSHLREWSLMDYWYYSRYLVKTVSASVPDQEYLLDSDEVYSTDSSLVGDSEFADVIMYDAMLTGYLDKENDNVYQKVLGKRERAWDSLMMKYPDMVPLQTTTTYRFITDPLTEY